MTIQEKIKERVMEKINNLFPLNKEPIAIVSAIEFTCEEWEQREKEILEIIEKLKVHTILSTQGVTRELIYAEDINKLKNKIKEGGR